MNKKLALDAVSAEDIPVLEPLVAAYHEFEHIQTSIDKRKSAIQTLLDKPEFGGVWLIKLDAIAIGYIVLCRGFSFEFSGFDAFIDELFISSEFRGRGLGTKVFELIKAEAAKLDINALHLEVARDNHPARKLYAKTGFEARDKYVLMTLELT